MAFSSHYRLYHCVRVPFGLKKWSWMIQSVTDVKRKTKNGNLDSSSLNTLSFFRNHRWNTSDMYKKLLRPLLDCRATLKLKNSTFFTENIYYEVHSMRLGNIEISAHTSDTIQNIKQPRNVAEIQSCLGLGNASRRATQIFARIDNQRNRKIRKNQPQSFDDVIKDEKMTWQHYKHAWLPLRFLGYLGKKPIHPRHKCVWQTGGAKIIKEKPDRPPGEVEYCSRSLAKVSFYNTIKSSCHPSYKHSFIFVRTLKEIESASARIILFHARYLSSLKRLEI